MEQPQINAHNKQEYPPMHTAEHLLNGEIDRRFGCGRSFNAHVERKKSKLDYHMPRPLTDEEIRSLEEYVNTAITADVEVTEKFITQEDAAREFDMTRLPDEASEMVRVVSIGDYDSCLCAGTHVARTSEIGIFRISSSRYQDGVQRIVFRLD